MLAGHAQPLLGVRWHVFLRMMAGIIHVLMAWHGVAAGVPLVPSRLWLVSVNVL